MIDTTDISIVGAFASLLMPWIVGGIWTYWLLSRTPRWNVAIVIGHGYLVGLFITTLAIRLVDAAGATLSFALIATILVLTGLVGLALVKSRPGEARAAAARVPLPAWQLVVICFLLLLMAWRYATLAQEVLLRPLFPWDAWMNWAPKAIVWFHYETLVPFVSQQAWLAAPADALAHMEGARNAWSYPIGVPLIQLWGMLAIGDSDNTIIYLPWVMVAIALGTALYGHLRLLGHTSLTSTMAVFALANLSFVNVHSALAGYADLWVAAVFGCGIFALKEWDTSRKLPYAILCLLMVLFCIQLKIPGIIMSGILVSLLALSLLPRGKYLAWALLAAFVLLAYLFTFGLSLNIPALGNVVLGPDSIQLPYIGNFALRYNDINSAMIDTMLLMINWNMLWFITATALCLFIVRDRMDILYSFDVRALALTLGFIFFVYYFTARYRFALDYTQVNRALIYAVPVAILFVVSCLSSTASASQLRSGAEQK